MQKNPCCSIALHGLQKKETLYFMELWEITMGKRFTSCSYFFLGNVASLIGTKNLQRYRDDGLEVIHKANGPKINRIKTDVIALFKSEGLSISIDTNLIATDFLGVSFKLEMNKFFSYTKSSSTPLYIHSELNHPPPIIKQLPSMTNKRIPVCHGMKMNLTRLTLFMNQV